MPTLNGSNRTVSAGMICRSSWRLHDRRGYGSSRTLVKVEHLLLGPPHHRAFLRRLRRPKHCSWLAKQPSMPERKDYSSVRKTNGSTIHRNSYDERMRSHEGDGERRCHAARSEA